MDDAVEEVFLRMLERRCAAASQELNFRPDISVRIGFSGALEAQCVVEFLLTSAQRITQAFLGTKDTDWDEAMITDAVGEFCNMVAGGWKRRLGPPAWQAALSVPSISHGPTRSIDPASATLRRVYIFDDSPFVVSFIALKQNGAGLPASTPSKCGPSNLT